MIPVSEARARLIALVSPTEAEIVPLRRAAGRVVARDVVAARAQPPFDASSMDGYALAGPVTVDATLPVLGEAAAGHPYPSSLRPGAAVRILTGAPLPRGADRVVIQEDVGREGSAIRLRAAPEAGENVRPAGCDFPAGERLAAPFEATPAAVALMAAMGHGAVWVARRPVVAIAMTGDELVAPGTTPGPAQITASNGYGLAAMVERAGAEARILPVARDAPASLRACLALARDADIVVTIGGASVGDHDIVASVLGEDGLDLAFHKVWMRPGKPLMAGRLGRTAFVGLPGNPVSAMVCGTVFVLPMIRASLGLPTAPEVERRTLAAPLPANGPREHYMRARTAPDGQVTVFDRQDSSLLTVLARADALVVRPPDDPPRAAGDAVDVLRLGPPSRGHVDTKREHP